MSDRLLTILNAVLALVCAACIYYLVSARYEEPAEVREARRLVGGAAGLEPGALETVFGPGGTETAQAPLPSVVAPRTPTAAKTPPMNFGILSKPLFQPLYTPTPTPTPPPTPTPAPPSLEQGVATWIISSIIDEQTVEFQDARNQETFTMTVGGPTVEARDQANQAMPVTLQAVDMNELKVTLGFEGQQVVKTFQ